MPKPWQRDKWFIIFEMEIFDAPRTWVKSYCIDKPCPAGEKEKWEKLHNAVSS